MKVMLHPDKHLVDASVEACISVKPICRNARVYNMGTVMLSDVSFVVHQSGVLRAQREQSRNVHAWMSGELISEHSMQIPLTYKMRESLVRVTYHYNVGRFLTVSVDSGSVVDVTDGQYSAGYAVGNNFYIANHL